METASWASCAGSGWRFCRNCWSLSPHHRRKPQRASAARKDGRHGKKLAVRSGTTTSRTPATTAAALRKQEKNMNKAEGLISNQQQALGNISASQYAATRESAQSIVDGMKKLHQREFAAWSWLARAMD